ncbi:DUF5085 family protein [Aquibacillus kalidii]|uniref:DUF5085 family protein n=1 Tax=Aquibacillus kalidii TaxID=2762597 RepID=UPI001646A32D|nr:DUF5085 family protein [Aquibacillus kalidii]
MINPNESIRFTNVVARKYEFHYKDFEIAMKDFTEQVARNHTIKGPFFYSVNNVPKDEIMLTEFFMPIKEHQVNNLEAVEFHSYFSVEGMISIPLHSDFENNTETAYALLLDYMEKNNYEQVTPFFHIISGDRNFPYVFIKVGAQ